MKNNKYLPYLLIFPSVLVFVLFTILPVIYMFYLSLHKGSIVKPAQEFIGFDNYFGLFKDPTFIEAVGTTMQYAFTLVIVTVLLAVPLALWLSKKDSKIHQTLTSLIFSPHVIAMVSVALIFSWIFDTENGILNWFLTWIRLEPVGWLTDPKIAIYTLVIVALWKGIGYDTLLVMSTVSGLPADVYEAAAIDNTPKWRLFMRITLPFLSPTIFFVFIVNLISNIQVFDTINIMTGGGPANSTTTIVFFLYEEIFKFSDIGEGAAVGILLLIILVVLNLIYFRLLGKRVYYK